MQIAVFWISENYKSYKLYNSNNTYKYIIKGLFTVCWICWSFFLSDYSKMNPGVHFRLKLYSILTYGCTGRCWWRYPLWCCIFWPLSLLRCYCTSYGILKFTRIHKNKGLHIDQFIQGMTSKAMVTKLQEYNLGWGSVCFINHKAVYEKA